MREQLVTSQHRTAVLLQGSLHWAITWLEQQAGKKLDEIDLVFSHEITSHSVVSYKTYRHHLGTENKDIFFADGDFNVDAFAALSGTLVAGGIVFIWLPEEKVRSGSNFLTRFYQLAKQQAFVYQVKESEQGNLPLAIVDTSAKQSVQPITLPTSGQISVISAVQKVAFGARNKPLVITADRGRGKSTSLALAVAELLLQADRATRIIVTAPHRMAVDIFYHQLASKLIGAVGKAQGIHWQQHCVDFIAVDEVIRTQPAADLVIVDEAAGIPVYLLASLIDHYHRMVFSSTVHGYEGAGKGFTAKFLPLLATKFKQVNHIKLTQPIRWAEEDPLEQLIFDTCLLDAELPSFTNDAMPNNYQIEFRVLSGDELAKDEVLLRQVFAILVTAHYQTKPSDLKLMLDDASISIMLLLSDDVPIAVTLLIAEGIVDEQLKLDVIAGKRRLKGHIVPQSLAQQVQLPTAFDYRYLRVMRIAVHPSCQGQAWEVIY